MLDVLLHEARGLLDAAKLVDAEQANLDAIDLVSVRAVVPEARDSGVLECRLGIVKSRSTIVK